MTYNVLKVTFLKPNYKQTNFILYSISLTGYVAKEDTQEHHNWRQTEQGCLSQVSPAPKKICV